MIMRKKYIYIIYIFNRPGKWGGGEGSINLTNIVQTHKEIL